MSISPNKKRRKNNRIKVRKKLKSPALTSSTGNQCPQPLRQKLELKGPRVKHVCRSASVALGQPIATFPAADAKEDNEHGKNIPKTAKEMEKAEKKDDVTKEKEAQKHVEDSNLNLNVNVTQQSHSRRGKPQQSVSTHFPVVRSLEKQSEKVEHAVRNHRTCQDIWIFRVDYNTSYYNIIIYYSII